MGMPNDLMGFLNGIKEQPSANAFKVKLKDRMRTKVLTARQKGREMEDLTGSNGVGKEEFCRVLTEDYIDIVNNVL